ncbi:MAG TPA: microviridin/marinostatin family tricyclic proteinase inhibitor [Blastocatellia bacterium]|nr:microviridin/marinostatin family tricyclic proteinase inhibitor [Blastocatellia bacterium]
MSTENEQPFFVKFLEGEEFPGVKTNVKAGATTRKFPSDTDEGDVTHKFPSDSDEGEL